VAKTGIRASNDLVWIGRAANYAAKLSALNEAGYPTLITDAVYKKLNEGSKYAGNLERTCGRNELGLRWHCNLPIHLLLVFLTRVQLSEGQTIQGDTPEFEPEFVTQLRTEILAALLDRCFVT